MSHPTPRVTQAHILNATQIIAAKCKRNAKAARKENALLKAREQVALGPGPAFAAANGSIKVFPFHHCILRCVLHSRHTSSVTWSEKGQREYKITSGLRRKILCVHLPDRYLGEN